MKLTKGTILKAKGGWDAEVIFINGKRDGFYAVHKPGTCSESCPVFHWADGSAHSAIVVNEPPSYNGHPADLEMGEYEL